MIGEGWHLREGPECGQGSCEDEGCQIECDQFSSYVHLSLFASVGVFLVGFEACASHCCIMGACSPIGITSPVLYVQLTA